jgi:hypothetical protein
MTLCHRVRDDKLLTSEKWKGNKEMKKTTIEIMRDYLNTNTNTSDNGRNGKAFEIAIRSYIMNRTAKSVKAQGKTDIRFTFDGSRHTCEIKTACGEIEQAAKNQYVIYCSNVDINEPAESQGYIFTREEWQAFVNGYNGRGSFVRVDTKRGHAHIQSFYVSESIRPKASKPIARYIAESLANQPTVEEFFNK